MHRTRIKSSDRVHVTEIMTKLMYKSSLIFLMLVTSLVLSFSIYAQYIMGLQPCPLCLMQRMMVFLLMVLMLFHLSFIKKAYWFSLLQIIVASAGLFFSLRHLWLQSLPSGSAAVCMPGLDVLVHYFPWQTVAKALLWGASDCAEKSWSLWGISMPGWSALYFLFMVLMSLFLHLHAKDCSNNVYI